MQIHHLNCGSLSPVFPKVNSIVYCLLIETNEGPVLVDTGFGKQDYLAPTRRIDLFLKIMGVPRNIEETAAHQVARLGYSIEDVRHIILTHLHFDHAGGLPDFPEAVVHIYRPEYEAAMKPRKLMEIGGYEASYWAHNPKWSFYDQCDTDWFGFDAIQLKDITDPQILLIPLPGHTRGHCGVVIQTEDGWLFHCGDAASPFHRGTDLHQRDEANQFLSFLPMWFTHRVIGSHVPRLRHLSEEHGDIIKLISAHDVFTYSEFQTKEHRI
jgi:glyoxylase-like metal-dependent hydrolase (beta-lactamase superfamily II)